jgi:hypothetical protein
MADQNEWFVLIWFFECHRGVPPAGPMRQRVANVAARIPWGVIGVGRDGRHLHPARELLKPGQHSDSLRPISDGALDFPAGEFEANGELRCQPLAMRHDNQNVVLRAVKIEQQRGD